MVDRDMQEDLLQASITLGDALGGGDGKFAPELAREAVDEMRALRAKVSDARIDANNAAKRETDLQNKVAELLSTIENMRADAAVRIQQIAAFERAEETGLDATTLHHRLDRLQESIDRRPVVVAVEGGRPTEVNVRDPHDGHSHLYVSSHEYERVREELRFFAELHANDGDDIGKHARAALKR
jgi:hypothetical protein